MTELATGYISLVVETSKIPKQVGDAMKGVEAQADKTGKTMGEKLGTGLKRTAAGAGIAAGAALGTAITKGVGRLTGIENAEASLRGLGHSADSVGDIMENALASVRGTSYGLDEAATIAASAVAAGIEPGRELERTLKLTGDAAAIAGVGLNEMGSIVNKVATSDMMQMDVANQMMDAGIPILQMVGEEMGVTAEEARKLASAGQVSFETFQSALEKGVGGAALELGDTVQGSFANMGAAAGRLGATLAGPFFNQASGAFGGVSDMLDRLNDAVAPAMGSLDAWISGTVVPGLTELASSASEAWQSFANSGIAVTSMARLEALFGRLLDAGVRLAPAVGGIVSSLGQASASIGISTWEMLLSVLESSAVILDATLVPALELTANLMQDNQGAVTALVAAFMAFKTIPGIMGRVGAVFAPLKQSMKGLSEEIALQQHLAQMNGQEVGKLGGAFGMLQSKGTGAWAGIKKGASDLLGVFGGPLGAAMTGVTIAATAAIASHQKMESSQRALEDASQDLAMAQTDMWAQIGDAAGVTDAVVDQIRAIRDEMDAAIAGRMDTSGFSGLGDYLNASMKNFSWEGLGASFRGENLGAEMVAETQRIADAAQLAQDALDSLGVSNDDLAAKITGNAQDWHYFRAQLIAAAGGSEDAAAGVDGLRAEFERLQAAQEIATPGALELSAAVDVLADSAATGDEKLSALKRALQSIGVLETDAEAAMFDLADAVDKVVESALEGADAAAGLGDELLTMDGKLDPAVANARALRDELGPLRDTILSAAESTGDADAAFAASAPAIEALAEKYRLTTDQVREFLGVTPENLEMLISLDGADEVRQTLTEVALAMDNLPDDEPKVFTTKLDEASAADTIAALEGIGLKVEEIEGQPGMVTITADGEIAVTAMNMIAQQLAGLDASVATPDINADTTIFRLEDESVRASLQHLDYSHVDTSVGAIIDDFINGRDVTLSELARIDATVADPHIKAEISEALQKAKTVNEALDRAARERTAYITTVHRGASQYDTAGVQVGHHYGNRATGGRIPRNADGGRLPTTGPGTSVTDGILGVDSTTGAPTSWVDAGEWVINGDSSDDYNRVLGLINRDDPSVRHLKGYQHGGRVSADEVLDFLHARTNDGQSRSLQSAPYDWAGINWGDCSATQAAAWRFATGQAPFGGRFATASQLEAVRSMGGVPGPGGPDDLTTAWYNGGAGGGHTTGSVGGVHFEMGGSPSMGKIGGSAASPFTGSWQHIYHLPLGDRFDWSDSAYTGRRGTGLTIGDYTADAFSGRTSFGARGGTGTAGQSRPTTWSGLAGDEAAQIVGGLTEDALGVFGVPNMLPPALQAWNMLNEPVGDGPTDWDLSVIAARVKQLDAETKVREQFVDEAQRAIDDVNHSPVGNALPAQMIAAQDQLDAENRELDRVRTEWEHARTNLEDALAARAEVLAQADNRGASDRELAETAASEVGELADQIDTSHTYDPNRGAEQWTPLIDKLLLEKGLPLSYRDAVIHRMDQESSGNPGAINDWDSNAAAGIPSKGLMQTIDPTFQSYKDPGFDDIWDPEANIRASMNYVLNDPKFNGRSLEDVYRQAGSYFVGGEVTLPPGMQAGVDNVPAWLTVGERVVKNGPSQRYAPEIDAMNAGTYEQPGGSTHFHYQVMSNEEADRHRRNTERQRAAEKVGVR